MADYAIPDRDIVGFLAIANLTEKDFKKLLKKLGDIADELPLFEIRNLFKKLELFDLKDRDAVSSILVAIFILRIKADEGSEEFADDIIRAVKNSKSELISGFKDWIELKKRILEILQLNSIYSSVKAFSLKTDSDKILVESKILTDIRPIFDNSNTDHFTRAIVVHNLKIIYHKDDEHKSIMLSLSGDNLQDLKKIILRAEKKESAIKSSLGTVKIISTNVKKVE